MGHGDDKEPSLKREDIAKLCQSHGEVIVEVTLGGRRGTHLAIDFVESYLSMVATATINNNNNNNNNNHHSDRVLAIWTPTMHGG